MAYVEHNIHIDEPPSAVWTVLTDVERTPEWTTTMTKVVRLDSGPFGMGSSARINQPGGARAVWTVTAYDDGRSFDWVAHPLPGLSVLATHVLTPVDGGTDLTLGITISGAASPVLKFIFAPLSQRYIGIEARGLKSRVEGSAAAT